MTVLVKSLKRLYANGKVTAKKPGSTTITVTADKVSVTCHVTVKKPTVKLITAVEKSMINQLHHLLNRG